MGCKRIRKRSWATVHPGQIGHRQQGRNDGHVKHRRERDGPDRRVARKVRAAKHPSILPGAGTDSARRRRNADSQVGYTSPESRLSPPLPKQEWPGSCFLRHVGPAIHNCGSLVVSGHRPLRHSASSGWRLRNRLYQPFFHRCADLRIPLLTQRRRNPVLYRYE